MLNQIDLSRIDLNLFILFETVMETRHVGRAAEALSLSPSAVSHGLGRLRRMLDDPLFLKTPKGVEPTDRARTLAPAIADILARARGVVASAKPFDPAQSKRRFIIGAPDGISAVILPPLLARLQRSAPKVDIAIRQLLPKQGEHEPGLAWRDALGELESRAMDAAIMPTADVPIRFTTHALYEEDFVIAVRARHPFTRNPTLERYCAAQHLVVSETGDAFGFVDATLAKRKLTRRVALTVPNFMFALATLAESDFISALPRSFVAMHGARFGVVAVEPEIKLPRFKLTLVAPTVALKDAGLAWLVSEIEHAAATRKRRRT
jgi:DNA-binding transcriptional LysR family regulator